MILLRIIKFRWVEFRNYRKDGWYAVPIYTYRAGRQTIPAPLRCFWPKDDPAVRAAASRLSRAPPFSMMQLPRAHLSHLEVLE